MQPANANPYDLGNMRANGVRTLAAWCIGRGCTGKMQLVYLERVKYKIYFTDSRFSKGLPDVRTDAMQSVLVGIFVIFLPSILMVAWLVWQAHGCSSDGGLHIGDV